jgi:hypothetical protein
MCLLRKFALFIPGEIANNNNILIAFPSFDIETDKANAGPPWGKWVEQLK